MWNGKKKALTFSFDDGVSQDRRLIGILDRYGLKAEECLFVDDLLDNVKAAEELGFHGLNFLNGPEGLEEALRTVEEVAQRLG
jgi:methionine salvage enolase-phosphatase E1